MIPSWQFSLDPGVNIKLNPHVQYPAGWTQSTIQPVGPAYMGARISNANLEGLRASADCTCVKEFCSGGGDCTCTEWKCPDGRGGLFSKLKAAFRPRQAIVWGGGKTMRGLGVPIARMLGDADSWAYRNRGWLVFGGLGLVTAAGIGLGAKLSKKRR